MKIIEAIIKNDSLIITLDNSANITKLYLDNIYNEKNIYSDDDSNHTYVITEGLGNNNTFTIDISAIKEKAFIVTVIGSDKDITLAIDKDTLYQDILTMLCNYCDTCLCTASKERILMVELRSNLLKYALDNNLTKDAIKHYIDLDRILNDKIINNTCCI